MEFNATTFVLEIVNFLVLLWVLQRLFYRPVLAAIQRRKSEIDKTLADGQALRQEALAQKALYEGRMNEWAKEREQALMTLAQDIETERAKRQAKLDGDLAEERVKADALQQRRFLEQRHVLEQEAQAKGAQFVAAFLNRLACETLEGRLIEAAIEDLGKMESSRIRNSFSMTDALGVQVASAYTLSDAQRRQLQEAMSRLIGMEAICAYSVDPDLIAGIRVSLGPWVLRANARDELQFFAEEASHESI